MRAKCREPRHRLLKTSATTSVPDERDVCDSNGTKPWSVSRTYNFKAILMTTAYTLYIQPFSSFSWEFIVFTRCKWPCADSVQHRHVRGRDVGGVLRLLSSYLKMTPDRMDGAWKGTRLRLAETSAIPGTAANNEGELLTNGSEDEAIGRRSSCETDDDFDDQDVEDN